MAEYTYDTFGRTIAQSGPMADAFAFRFSTKYFDAETGLYYYGYRFYSPTLTRWLSRDPANEDEGVNLYAYCGNDSINQYDYIGLSWRIIRRTTEPGGSVYLQGDIAALAEWQSDNSPDFDTLARNIGLNADEVLAWARKDANGTRFSSRAELSKSCNFYIPNRILVITHDAENFTYGLKRYFSRRLNQWGERMADYYTSLRGYAQLHYRYSYPQGGPTNGDRQIDPGHLQWPTAGFVIAAHGKKGLLPEQRIERGASVMYGNGGDEYQLTPLNFMGPRGYKFSFVYVAFCFAGSLSWNDLASQNADFFISPGWRAEAEVFLPSKPNPPRW